MRSPPTAGSALIIVNIRWAAFSESRTPPVWAPESAINALLTVTSFLYGSARPWEKRFGTTRQEICRFAALDAAATGPLGHGPAAVARPAAPGAGKRHPLAVPARSQPDHPFPGVPASEAEDAGLRCA